MSKRAVLYARVSRDDAYNSTSSLAGQLDMCRALAAERGYVVIAELADNDVSGARMDAPELGRALDMARAGQFDVLIARELDRLSRSLAKQLIVEEDLKRAGVSIEYALGEYPDTPEGSLNKNIKAVVAEYERLKVVERLARGRMNKVSSGSVLVSTRPPFGYDCVRSADGKRFVLVINEEQAQIVRMVYFWYVSEGLKAYAITLRLNAAGIPSPKGAKWYPAVVHRMLSSETYAGTWYYNKGKSPEKRIPVTVPAIVERQTWEAAQAQKVKNSTDAFRNRKYDYLVARRVTCAACGGAMCVNGRRPGATYSYYTCITSRSKWATNTCDAERGYFRTDVVDAAVWRWVCKLLLEPELIELGYSRFSSQLDKELEPLRRHAAIAGSLLSKEQAKLDKLLDLYLSGDMPKELLVEHRARLEGRVAALAGQYNELTSRIQAVECSRVDMPKLLEFVSDIGDGLNSVDALDDFAQKRQIVEHLDVRASLVIEDGERVVYLSCKIGQGRCVVNKKQTVYRLLTLSN